MPAPASLEETGLRLDLVIATARQGAAFRRRIVGHRTGGSLGLPFSAIEPGIDALKAQRLCEIVGGTTIGPPSYRYRITTLGRERAAGFLASNAYVGHAPVPFWQLPPLHGRLRRGAAEAHRAGPGRAGVFASGPEPARAGPTGARDQFRATRCSSTARRATARPSFPRRFAICSRATSGSRMRSRSTAPIIKVFDPINHDALTPPKPARASPASDRFDRRWVRCRRPAVTVGGELTLEALDLIYNPGLGLLSRAGATARQWRAAGDRRLRPAALLAAGAAEPVDLTRSKPASTI